MKTLYYSVKVQSQNRNTSHQQRSSTATRIIETPSALGTPSGSPGGLCTFPGTRAGNCIAAQEKCTSAVEILMFLKVSAFLCKRQSDTSTEKHSTRFWPSRFGWLLLLGAPWGFQSPCSLSASLRDEAADRQRLEGRKGQRETWMRHPERIRLV